MELLEQLKALPTQIQGIMGGLGALTVIGWGLWAKARSSIGSLGEDLRSTELQLRSQIDSEKSKARQIAEKLATSEHTLQGERKASGDLSFIQARLSEVSAAVDAHNQTLNTRLDEIATAERDLTQLKSDLEGFKAHHAKSKTELDGLSKLLDQRQKERTEVENVLRTRSEELKKTEAKLAESQAAIKTVEAQIADRGPIAKSINDIEAKLRAVAEQQLGQLRGASEAILKEAATLRQQIDAIPKN